MTKGLCDSSPFLTSSDEKWAAIIGFDILQFTEISFRSNIASSKDRRF
jgi:hypothetical protein